jgi:sRNA-binding protein
LYNAHAQNSVYQDKAALVDSTNIINNAGPSTSQQSPQPQPQPTNKKRATSKAKICSRKKPKRLQVKDIKDLPLNQKVHVLVGAL